MHSVVHSNSWFIGIYENNEYKLLHIDINVYIVLKSSSVQTAMLNVVMDCSVFMNKAYVLVFHTATTNLMSTCVKVNEYNLSTYAMVNENNLSTFVKVNENNICTCVNVNENNLSTYVKVNENNQSTCVNVNENNQSTCVKVNENNITTCVKVNENNLRDV